MSYYDYLNSDEWKQIRQERLYVDGYACVLCGSEEDLVVHHMYYPMKDRKHDDTINNLITLCESCHTKTHGIHSSNKKAAVTVGITNKCIISQNNEVFSSSHIGRVFIDGKTSQIKVLIDGVECVAAEYSTTEQISEEMSRFNTFIDGKTNKFRFARNIPNYAVLNQNFDKYQHSIDYLKDVSFRLFRFSVQKSYRNEIIHGLDFCLKNNLTQLSLEDFENIYGKQQTKCFEKMNQYISELLPNYKRDRNLEKEYSSFICEMNRQGMQDYISRDIYG